METSIDDKAIEFAKNILRKHPQISFEHAAAAAVYDGIPDLPQNAFFSAIRRLSIVRQDPNEELRLANRAREVRDASRQGPVDSRIDDAGGGAANGLIGRLETLRLEVKETSEMREALVGIRNVVRKALEDL